MKGEWCYFKSYLNAETCKKIINDSQQLPWQEAHLGVGENLERVDSTYRRSKIRFMHSNDWRFTYVFDMLWKTAINANDDFFQFNISKLDYVQFAEYDSANKGEYKSHHDVFWMNNDPVYHRKLSCVIQLSDPNDYDGGDLIMEEAVTKPLQSDIKLQGTITYFPSFMRHLVTPVTRGKRYSLTAWFDGKKWT